MAVEYVFTKSPVDIGKLNEEIVEAGITTPIVFSTWNEPDQLYITFDSALSSGDHTIVAAVVSTHGGEAIPWPADLPTFGAVPRDALIISNGVDSTYWGYDNFLNLSDTPITYSGSKDYFVKISPTESGIVFVDVDTSGLVHFIAHTSDETTSSTTSKVFQDKLTLITPLLPASDYIVMWYYEWQYKDGSFQFKAQIILDENELLLEQYEEPAGTNSWSNSSGFKRVTLSAVSPYGNGIHHIDIKYCSSKSGKEAKIRAARLELWRV